MSVVGVSLPVYVQYLSSVDTYFDAHVLTNLIGGFGCVEFVLHVFSTHAFQECTYQVLQLHSHADN